MDKLYETKISDARWWAYDIPGNIGWIIYIVCLATRVARGLRAFEWAALIPAACMLLGVIELISERVAGLDRVLPRLRVLRGFGALTLGGVLGAAVSIVGLVAGVGGAAMWMLAGAALCAVFAGLCCLGYKPMRDDGRARMK